MSTVRILLICTANQCRSPMAEAILSDIASRRGLDVALASAGFLHDGEEATDLACRAVAKIGLDLRAHRSRVCGVELPAAADLILTMERAHLFQIAQLDPSAIDRSFTLVELARLAAASPRDGDPADFAQWVAALHSGRDAGRILHMGRSDDVADPTGRSLRQHRRTAERLVELLATVADAAWPETRDEVPVDSSA